MAALCGSSGGGASPAAIPMLACFLEFLQKAPKRDNGHPEGWPLSLLLFDEPRLPLGLPPVDEIAKSCGRAGDGGLVGLLLVGLDLCAAGLVAHCAQAQAHLLLFHVDLDDLELVLQACFQLIRRPRRQPRRCGKDPPRPPRSRQMRRTALSAAPCRGPRRPRGARQRSSPRRRAATA